MATKTRTTSSRRSGHKLPPKTTTAPVDATAVPDASAAAPRPSAAEALSHERIAQRAYLIWLSKGRPVGRDMEHWLEAERQLIGEQLRK